MAAHPETGQKSSQVGREEERSGRAGRGAPQQSPPIPTRTEYRLVRRELPHRSSMKPPQKQARAPPSMTCGNNDNSKKWANSTVSSHVPPSKECAWRASAHDHMPKQSMQCGRMGGGALPAGSRAARADAEAGGGRAVPGNLPSPSVGHRRLSHILVGLVGDQSAPPRQGEEGASGPSALLCGGRIGFAVSVWV